MKRKINKQLRAKSPRFLRSLNKFTYWTPRILSILFICFLTMFSLDVFEEGYNFWGTVLALFMHNVPVFTLLGILIVSWKHEIVGSVAFILAGFLYATLIIKEWVSDGFEPYMISWVVLISGPAFLIGFLFFQSWRQKKFIRKI